MTHADHYLDIVEDSWISSDVRQLNITGLTPHYMFKGTIELSSMAVITGLETWRGDTTYRAGLRKSEYIQDRSYRDSAAFVNAQLSRIALLQQHTGTSYELTLAGVDLGERTRVRIRYLLPNDATQGIATRLSVLLSSRHGANPRQVKIVWGGSPGETYSLKTPAGIVSLDTSAIYMGYLLPMNSRFHGRNKPRPVCICPSL